MAALRHKESLQQSQNPLLYDVEKIGKMKIRRRFVGHFATFASGGKLSGNNLFIEAPLIRPPS